MKSWIFTGAKVIISAALLALAIQIIGLGKIYLVLSQISLLHVLIALISIAINIVLGAENINLLLLIFNKKIPRLKLLRYYITAWSIGLFVPGKLGEFSIIAYFKNRKITIAEGLIVSVLDKAITLVVLLGFSLIGAYFLLPFSTFAVIFSLFILIFGGFAFFVFTPLGSSIIEKLFFKKALRFKDIISVSKQIYRKPELIIANFALTFVKWMVTAVAFYEVLRLLGQNINLFWVAIIYSTTIIISLIPISLSGLGVKEGAAYLMFSASGIDATVAFTAYLMFTIIGYCIAIIGILSAPKE